MCPSSIRKLLCTSNCFYAGVFSVNIFCFVFPSPKIISKLSVYLICTVKEQKGKRNLELSGRTCQSDTGVLGFKCQKLTREKKCKQEMPFPQRLLEYSLP